LGWGQVAPCPNSRRRWHVAGKSFEEESVRCSHKPKALRNEGQYASSVAKIGRPPSGHEGLG